MPLATSCCAQTFVPCWVGGAHRAAHNLTSVAALQDLLQRYDPGLSRKQVLLAFEFLDRINLDSVIHRMI